MFVVKYNNGNDFSLYCYLLCMEATCSCFLSQQLNECEVGRGPKMKQSMLVAHRSCSFWHMGVKLVSLNLFCGALLLLFLCLIIRLNQQNF